ncbi:MAG: OmpA family protein [Candidatus Accumulibacter sp.]|jgi:OOP family OmpA-OmpF porin|nr:OmpA family protein [Accumulibacter sp.]
MKTLKHTLMAVVATTLGLCASLAYAQARVYAVDQRGVVVKNSTGLCWRTGYWTPAAAAQDAAGCECDKDLLPRNVCEKTPAPQPKAVIGDEKVTLAADALFDFGKADLRPEGKAALDNIVARSQSLALEVVIAVGHADRIGSAALNQKLSERRAASVKSYLLGKGIPANRIYTEGKGSQQPATKAGECAGGKSAKVIACLQPDRRVDIEIIGTKK